MYTFEIKKKIRGVVITEQIIGELKETGRSHILKFKDGKGKQYLAHLEIKKSKIEVVPEAKHLKHRCPHCGGRVLITGKGYACENSLGSHPSCKFHCKGILSHRFIQPHEIEAYLDGHPLVLDGCFNGQGKVFSAILEENSVHGFALTSKVDKCPVSDNDVFVSPVAFNSYGNGEADSFSYWRHIKGHEVKLDELHELLTDGRTQKEVVLNDENGSLSKAVLRLSPDRKRIVPDFYPEIEK